MKRLAITFVLFLIGALSAAEASAPGSRSSIPAGNTKIPDTEYFQNMRLFWSRLYGKGGETLYCGQRFGPNKGRGINIEHIFPMSWVINTLNCRDRSHCRSVSPRFNKIEADMHNLYPARAHINKERGARAFGMVAGEPRKFGRCDFEIDRKRRLIEPRPEVRGNIARAMFYMHSTYGLKLFSRQGKLLKQWHREDPPDAGERHRNEIIERLQGKRNPFIDRPELVKNLRF